MSRSAVIDTNVWLDLFVFADPQALELGRALADGGFLQPVRSPRTDSEIESVLRRPLFAPMHDRAAQGFARWQSIAMPCEPATRAPWTCRDADDQKFLDLACATGSSFLFTKDKALLALHRRAVRDGLWILAPVDFGRGIAQDGVAKSQRVVEGVMPA